MSRYFVAILLLAVVALAAAEEKKCLSNEKWDMCGRMCEPTCDNPNPNPEFCPNLQCTSETSSCRCEKGYVRNDEGECVLEKQC
ncbi:chymotrypsin inhibitor-like [Colletes latitarsis]|uniref:chymotrypsin inhibitor-like n=1 Tax=Colletes latitarsis TaxID=2605962 RepID=UPI0040372A06